MVINEKKKNPEGLDIIIKKKTLKAKTSIYVQTEIFKPITYEYIADLSA